MPNKEYFDDMVKEWDRTRKTFFSENVREKAFAVANIRNGTLAVDVGAGTGFITEGLIEKRVKVIAVDQSEKMIEEMKKKFTKVKDIDYRIGDVENLPIQEKTVDYTFANMVLHHIESPHLAIKEMTRVLKIGGKLVITDLDEHNYEFLRREHQDRWMGFKRDDVRKWLLEAGLKNVNVDCVGENCCTTSSCENQNAIISIFVAFGEKK